MRWMHRVALAAFLVSAVGAATAQDGGKGPTLLAEARKALGGDERLGAVRTVQVKGDFKRMAGQSTIEGELQLQLALPDKMRRDEDLSLPGGGPAIVRTEVLNGTEFWEESSGDQFFLRRGGPDGGGGARRGATAGMPGPGRGGRGPIDSEQIRQFQLRQRQADLARLTLALLMRTNDVVTWVGIAQSPDGTADVLEVKPAEGSATRIFLDRETHLPLMLTWQGFAPQTVARRGRGADAAASGEPPPAPPRPPLDSARDRQQTTLRMTLGEYKAVNGIQLPHVITRGVNDQTTEEWSISSYRLNPAIKAETFIKQ